jgi:2-dehydropantoate 2-reductase
MHLIIGAGAVGTVLAGCLLNAGKEVTLMVPVGRLDWYMQSELLQVDDNHHRARYRFPAPEIVEIGNTEALKGVSHIYLATKYSGLSEVLNWLKAGEIASNVQIISCLNGIAGKHQAAEQLGRPVEFMTVMFNARRDGPLQAALTTKEIVQFESPNSPLGKLFKQGGAVVQAGSAEGMWGKLLINLNNSICALCDSSFLDMFSNPDLKGIYIAVLDESIPLLEQHQIKYKLPMPLSWKQFRWLSINASPVLSFAAKHLNGLTADSVPSMVADMRARRVTEVAELNGEFVRLAAAINQTSPLNQQIVAQVKAMEQGDEYKPLSPSQLKRELKLG